MIEKSCGLILYRKRENKNELEFFLSHPGGPHNKYKDYWLFPKGHIEEIDIDTESILLSDLKSWMKSEKNAAIREYIEETGDKTPIKLNINPTYIGQVRQSKKKIVYVFAHVCTWDLKPEDCFSNTIEVEYKGEIITIPENDDYKWMTYNELKDKTHEKHLPFYQKIIENPQLYTIENTFMCYKSLNC